MKKTAMNIIMLLAYIISPFINAQNYCDSSPVNVHGNLNVSGNKIVDQNNSTVSFAGNSLFWSNTGWGGEDYYTSGVISTLKNNWNTTIVRAAMGVEDSGGYLSDSSNKDRVKTVVDAAIAEGLYVIIDWHSHSAENYQQQAIEFFQEMATLYGNYPNVIYEIYNEPIYSSWSNNIKPYAEAVISAIRAIDPDNLIIVGTPTWSQDVDVASNDPITSSTNIAYTLHFYAGTHGASYRAKAQTALNNGIALMVTEWGTVDASGDGSVNYTSTQEWMDFLQENDISHLNWSINDKAEGASALNSGASDNGDWNDSNYTQSGAYVKTIIEGWTQYCDGEPVDSTTEYISIPSKIEAEDYHSQLGIETEDTTDVDGGKNVGWINTNDYLTYNINVPSSGNYTIDFRVASKTTGTNFDIYANETLIRSVFSEATDGWQTWETVSETVSLTEGNQTIKIVATLSGWNINWLEFSEEEETTAPTTEYVSIPTKIEAEDYDDATEGRTQTVNTVTNVGWIDSGEYLSYNINVPSTGEYSAEFRLASQSVGSEFDIYQDNVKVGNISSNATGGWQTWETISTTITLSAGDSVLKIVATGSSWNIDWIELSENEETTEPNETPTCNNTQTWSSTTVYTEGSMVLYENNIYENKWYSLGQNPAEYSVLSWDVWTFISACTSSKSSAEDNLEDINESEINESEIKIYTNSVKNLVIYIENLNDYSEISIYDVYGQKIITQKLSDNLSQIPLNNYNTGIYFANLTGLKTYRKSFILE